MPDFNETMSKLNQAEEILRTANMLEDEKAKEILFNTMTDVLTDTINLLKQTGTEEADEDE